MVDLGSSQSDGGFWPPRHWISSRSLQVRSKSNMADLKGNAQQKLKTWFVSEYAFYITFIPWPFHSLNELITFREMKLWNHENVHHIVITKVDADQTYQHKQRTL